MKHNILLALACVSTLSLPALAAPSAVTEARMAFEDLEETFADCNRPETLALSGAWEVREIVGHAKLSPVGKKRERPAYPAYGAIPVKAPAESPEYYRHAGEALTPSLLVINGTEVTRTDEFHRRSSPSATLRMNFAERGVEFSSSAWSTGAVYESRTLCRQFPTRGQGGSSYLVCRTETDVKDIESIGTRVEFQVLVKTR